MYAGETQRGSQFNYSDTAIEIMLTIKEVFHVTNRSVEGFVRSAFAMLNIHLTVPDHSTLSKRGKRVGAFGNDYVFCTGSFLRGS